MALTAAPSSVWIISTLEIAVGWRGEQHLMLIHPSYPLAGQPNSPTHDEGYWAPPFVAYPVHIDYSPPTTAGSLLRLATEAAKSVDIEGGLHHLAYQMGLRDIHLKQRSAFLELKVSPRSPSLVKAYYILRHGLVGVDTSSYRNLADPEQRRGYVFLPLGQYQSATHLRHSEEHGRSERWFLGKPLMSNVEHVLGDDMRRLAISEESIDVDANLFNREERGILCVVDLAGYGTALRYALDHMHTFSTAAASAQDDFRRQVAHELHTMLGDIGSTQAQFAGDGFVAAFPERVFPDAAELTAKILTRWERLIDLVEQLNGAIRDPEKRVGTRLVLHHGAYTYGRIAGTRSFAAAFDGAAVIEAVRLEQGLAAASKERGTGVFSSLPQRLHLLAVSADLEARLKTPEGEAPFDRWSALGRTELTAKEYDGEALIFRFMTPDGER
ncbi:hypothetical protein [Streptomyces sp. NL15-2K]|uniref:hypothetical protein n=1 Tax=Streptomyces sp. NL15-2K TaxID=376149 RepID=UPI000F55A86F|nr:MULTISPECIES: hypothetical protein [Actinomycetes]WKX09453.1 hypothetical protein Q4V64_18955 [Kutzneria buriramensis]